MYVRHSNGTDSGLGQVHAAEALRALTEAVQDLSLADSVEEIQRIAARAARGIAGADGAAIVLREGADCDYVEEDAPEPLLEGTKLPIDSCLSGAAILGDRPVVAPDVHSDPRVPGDAYGQTFVRSLLAVPIRAHDPMGAIEIHWSTRHEADEDEMGLAQALADSTAVAITRVLDGANGSSNGNGLAALDRLTGLIDGRSWERALATKVGEGVQPLCIALLDINHLRAVNEAWGESAGDQILRESAEAWKGVVREGDVLARLGGDEFGVMLPRCEIHAARQIAERLRSAVPRGRSASVGLAAWDGEEDADALTARADSAVADAKAIDGGAVMLAR